MDNQANLIYYATGNSITAVISNYTGDNTVLERIGFQKFATCETDYSIDYVITADTTQEDVFKKVFIDSKKLEMLDIAIDDRYRTYLSQIKYVVDMYCNPNKKI